MTTTENPQEKSTKSKKPEQLTLKQKLMLIQRDIKTMPKDGKNSFQNYQYLSETQLTAKMKELLDEYGVLFNYSSNIVSETIREKQVLTTVCVIYSFVDSESEEVWTGHAVGQGQDTGDKGVYKAITGAIKYIYMKTFNIPTGDDPEKDSPGLAKAPATRSRYPQAAPIVKGEDDFIDTLPTEDLVD